jgi:hypothetical protein
MEFVRYHPSGAWNFELAPRCLENLWTPGLEITEIRKYVEEGSRGLICGY